MKEKCVTFCFIKLKAKKSPKSSGQGWFFCGSYVSWKLMFTLTLSPAETVAMK